MLIGLDIRAFGSASKPHLCEAFASIPSSIPYIGIKEVARYLMKRVGLVIPLCAVITHIVIGTVVIVINAV